VTVSLTRPLLHVVNRIYLNIYIAISTSFEEFRMDMKYTANFEA